MSTWYFLGGVDDGNGNLDNWITIGNWWSDIAGTGTHPSYTPWTDISTKDDILLLATDGTNPSLYSITLGDASWSMLGYCTFSSMSCNQYGYGSATINNGTFNLAALTADSTVFNGGTFNVGAGIIYLSTYGRCHIYGGTFNADTIYFGNPSILNSFIYGGTFNAGTMYTFYENNVSPHIFNGVFNFTGSFTNGVGIFTGIFTGPQLSNGNNVGVPDPGWALIYGNNAIFNVSNVDNYAYISGDNGGAIFSGNVTNFDNSYLDPTYGIYGSTFNGPVTNYYIIRGGTFNAGINGIFGPDALWNTLFQPIISGGNFGGTCCTYALATKGMITINFNGCNFFYPLKELDVIGQGI